MKMKKALHGEALGARQETIFPKQNSRPEARNVPELNEKHFLLSGSQFCFCDNVSMGGQKESI